MSVPTEETSLQSINQIDNADRTSTLEVTQMVARLSITGVRSETPALTDTYLFHNRNIQLQHTTRPSYTRTEE